MACMRRRRQWAAPHCSAHSSMSCWRGLWATTPRTKTTRGCGPLARAMSLASSLPRSASSLQQGAGLEAAAYWCLSTSFSLVRAWLWAFLVALVAGARVKVGWHAGFSTNIAVALSNITIVGGSIANFAINVGKRHHFLDRPLIDWDLIVVMEPATILGALAGGYLNRVRSLLLSNLGTRADSLHPSVTLLQQTCYTGLRSALGSQV